MTEVSPVPFDLQLFDNNGQVLSGGLVYTYQVNTLVPVTTYQDINGTVPNANPVVCNSSGRLSMWYSGDLRLIVKTSASVLVRDFNSTAPLRADLISDPLAPVTSAPTTAVARTLLGVDAAIATAISAVSLLSGPTGPAGGVGPTGPTGPAGSAASDYTITLVASNPGYFQFPNVGGVGLANCFVQFGSASSDGAGTGSVTFARSFPNACLSVVITCTTISWWASVTGQSSSGFTFNTSSPLHGGTWSGGPIGMNFIAIGY